MDPLLTLIQELEKERTDLLRLIDESVKEKEFLNAHFHSEALGRIERQLQTLKNLDDELYDNKYFLQNRIDKLRSSVQDQTDEKFKSVINRLILENEEELSKLTQVARRRKPDGNGKSKLRDYLGQFASGNIKGLHVTLSRSGNVSIEIRHARGGAKLTMRDLKKHTSSLLLNQTQLFKLQGLGFTLHKNGDRGTIVLQAPKEELADKIMRLISIIVFEIFYFKQLGDEASIEIINYRTTSDDKQDDSIV